MKNFVIFFTILLALNHVAMSQVEYLKNERATSSISYTMVHSLHDWTAVNRNIESILAYDPESSSFKQVVVAAHVSDFDSGNSNRDAHSLEVIESLKFPVVTFSSIAIDEKDNLMIITGILSFHGVKREVTFNVTKSIMKGYVHFSGAFDVLLSDYKVDRPSVLGMVVEDKFTVVFAMDYPLDTSRSGSE